EWIADLNCWPLFLVAFGKLGRCHGCAVNAVAAGLGADIEDRVSGRGAARIENLVLVSEADSHRVDEDIAIVTGVKLGFASNSRYADAVAVAADTCDDALDEAACLRVARVTEAKGIDQRNGPRTHGEHVT